MMKKAIEMAFFCVHLKNVIWISDKTKGLHLKSV